MNYVASGDTDKPHDGLSSGCTPQKGAERHVAENSEFGIKKSSSQYRLSLTSSVIWDKLLNLPKSVGFFFFFISKMGMVSAYSGHTKMSRIEFCT